MEHYVINIYWVRGQARVPRRVLKYALKLLVVKFAKEFSFSKQTEEIVEFFETSQSCF